MMSLSLQEMVDPCAEEMFQICRRFNTPKEIAGGAGNMFNAPVRGSSDACRFFLSRLSFMDEYSSKYTFTAAWRIFSGLFKKFSVAKHRRMAL